MKESDKFESRSAGFSITGDLARRLSREKYDCGAQRSSAFGRVVFNRKKAFLQITEAIKATGTGQDDTYLACRCEDLEAGGRGGTQQFAAGVPIFAVISFVTAPV